MAKKSVAEKATKKSAPVLEEDTRKAAFIRGLAEYLAGNQAHMSILLEMKKPEALAWAKLRGLTPLFGWPTVEEAEGALARFLR